MTRGVNITTGRKRTMKRPRSMLAASFLTTGFLLSFSSVRSAPSPTWKAFGFGEKNGHPSSNKEVNNNNKGIHRPEPEKIPPPDVVPMNLDDNNHHGVVRRPRREESTKDNEDSSKTKSEDKTDHESNTNGKILSSPEIPIYSTTKYRKPDPRSHNNNEQNVNTQFSVDSENIPSLNYTNTQEQREIYERQQQERFMNWCKDVLGIYTILEIKMFEYVDYMNIGSAVDFEDDITDFDEKNRQGNNKRRPKLTTRGLAASQDIVKGDVVIRIPVRALWSLATTIDEDPVLGGNVMGPEARDRHGWDTELDDGEFRIGFNESNITDTQFYEMPLLAVALLYHVQLGEASAYSPYIEILKATPVGSMPFLWTAKQLKESPASSEGMRMVARGIRQEMRDMYDAVVHVLINQHPRLFGKEVAQKNNREWMYSYDKFKWAFAIVNSRHWQLPIKDLEWHKLTISADTKPNTESANIDNGGIVSVDEQLPPASMPTEHWVKEHGDVDDEILDERTEFRRILDEEHSQIISGSHSFLAPVADLLNFGPPCTRGRYNNETHTFEIIATCSYRKGEEVTFWYSDECQHVIMGIYGFSHPLIPACPTSEELRSQTETLEEKLADAYAELDRLEKEFDAVEEILKKCECCRYDNKRSDRGSRRSPASYRRHNTSRMRGFRSTKSMKQDGKPGIRKTYSRRSEF